MSPVVVYGIGLSAPVRIVYMTCEALGIEYETKEVNLMKGEHMTEEYLKVRHCKLVLLNYYTIFSAFWDVSN